MHYWLESLQKAGFQLHFQHLREKGNPFWSWILSPIDLGAGSERSNSGIHRDSHLEQQSGGIPPGHSLGAESGNGHHKGSLPGSATDDNAAYYRVLHVGDAAGDLYLLRWELPVFLEDYE